MIRLQTTLLFLILTIALFGQNINKIEVVHGYSTPIANCKVELIHIKKIKKNQIALTDSNGIAHFKRFDLKKYKLKLTPEGNIYKAKTVERANSYKIELIHHDRYYDSLRALEIEKIRMKHKTLVNSWVKIDSFYDSLKATGFKIDAEEGEKQPIFPGGYQEMVRFLSRNIEYPQMAIEMAIEGKVFVEFKIQQDGQISHVKVVRGVDPYLDFEAERVVRSMPKWEAGQQRGRKVICIFTIPINFKLG